MPQIYDVLIQEHREVEQMLEQVTQSTPDAQQLEHLYKMLEAHNHAEEQTLYQDLQLVEQTHELSMEAIEEHHVADVILQEIMKLNAKDERVHAKLSVLKETVMHHVQEEEQELFPKAKQVKDGRWAEKMGQQFHEAEQEIKKTMD